MFDFDSIYNKEGIETNFEKSDEQWMKCVICYEQVIANAHLISFFEIQYIKVYW
jgi:hypothetical protein